MSDYPMRDILAANLQRIRRHRSAGDRLLSERAFAQQMGFTSESDVRLINRLLKSEFDVKLDTVYKIAEQLGLQPWQLLLDGFDPAGPQSMPMTAEEKKTLDNLRALLNRE